MQPAGRMTRYTERVNVSECCVMVGLAHSKFPFTHAHIPAAQFQFLKRMRCLCRDVWSSAEEIAGESLRINHLFVACWWKREPDHNGTNTIQLVLKL